MTGRKRDLIRQLRRRRDFLRQRVASRDDGGANRTTSYDRAEFAGLVWAIQELSVLYPALADPSDLAYLSKDNNAPTGQKGTR